MAKKHVFLSYCHDNTAEVEQLRTDLMNAGEKVWRDEDLLPGQLWKQEISQAMADSYAVILCFSKESQNRDRSGLYPEARDAIDAYREYKPGSIFLIPVRLSECEVPRLAIDATTGLDGLQRVDLFPPGARAGNLAKLIQALRRAPDHPQQPRRR